MPDSRPLAAAALFLLFGCGGGGDDASSASTAGDETSAESATITEDEVEAEEAGQTYAEAMDVLCTQSIAESGFLDAAPPDRALVLARWIDDHLVNEQAQALFASMAEMAPAERVAALTREAEGVGLERCELSGIYLSAG